MDMFAKVPTLCELQPVINQVDFKQCSFTFTFLHL